jgi:hypothetical protein
MDKFGMLVPVISGRFKPQIAQISQILLVSNLVPPSAENFADFYCRLQLPTDHCRKLHRF